MFEELTGQVEPTWPVKPSVGERPQPSRDRWGHINGLLLHGPYYRPMAHEPYPGGSARPDQVRALADEYRKAAAVLLKLGERGKPLTRAPFRLSAIHAVELYLNAFLLARGLEAEKIRGLQHDLPARAALAIAGGLSLRKRTLEHIRSLSAAREYLVSRYGPELAAPMSQINRLIATLDEVANKVTTALAIAQEPPRR